VFYRLKKAQSLGAYRKEIDPTGITKLAFTEIPPVYTSYIRKNTFRFLNKEFDFKGKIDWRFQEYGSLWNYNLQYFNFLLQDDIAIEEKLRLLDSIYTSGIILEPYPVSLRSINVIRLISKEHLDKPELIKNLRAELNFLAGRLEFHLLGNHLLENVFDLLM